MSEHIVDRLVAEGRAEPALARDWPYLAPILPPEDKQRELAAMIEQAAATQLSLQAAGLSARMAHRVIIGLPAQEPRWRCAHPDCPEPDDPWARTHAAVPPFSERRHPFLGRPVRP